MRHFIIAALALLTTAHAAEPKDEIRSVLETQAAAWNDGDIPAFMEGYAKSDALRFAGGNAVKRGYQGTLQRYLETYDTPEKMGALSFVDVEVDLLAEDVAMVFGRFLLERPKVGDATGLFTLIFRKTDAGWRIIHDHTST